MQDRSQPRGILLQFPGARRVVPVHAETLPLRRADVPHNVILFPANRRRSDATHSLHPWDVPPAA